MISRFITRSLLETLGYFPVTGIIGPRQVGKTTLVKYLVKQFDKESVYLDIENPEDFAKLTDPVLFFKRNQDRCVVLDEIQRMPQLFPVLSSSSTVATKVKILILILSMIYDLRLSDFQKV